MAAQDILTNVSRETIERLHEFEGLVVKWTKRINLIAPSTIPDIWERHILDSAQLYEFAPMTSKSWVDLGSGGGFPGLVLAILSKEENENQRFTLIESDQRKATFLRTAIRSLDLNARVICARIEEVPPQSASVVSARALSPLNDLLAHISRHLSPDGLAIVPKGRNANLEIEKANENWTFEMEQAPSITESDASILAIRGPIRERS